MQFHEYGALISFEIYILEDAGYIKIEECLIPPFVETVTIAKISSLGLKQIDKFKAKWRDVYVPKYELGDGHISPKKVRWREHLHC